MMTMMMFINSAALSKISRAAGTCHSVLTKRCAFRRRAKMAVDSVDRRSPAGKLFQVSGPETAKFLSATNGNKTVISARVNVNPLNSLPVNNSFFPYVKHEEDAEK